MPWEKYESWSEVEKDSLAKEADRINKAWGEKNEIERKERVAETLGFEENKSDVKSEDLTSESQNSSKKTSKCTIL